MKSYTTPGDQGYSPPTATDDLNVRALLISPFEDDRLRLLKIFHEYDWDLEHVENYKSARQFFKKDRVPIIIWNASVAQANWKDLVSELAPLPQPPRVFLISDVDDPSLARELRDQAGGDVLTKPLDEVEVGRRVRSAWLAWKRKVASSSAASPIASMRAGG